MFNIGTLQNDIFTQGIKFTDIQGKILNFTSPIKDPVDEAFKNSMIILKHYLKLNKQIVDHQASKEHLDSIIDYNFNEPILGN